MHTSCCTTHTHILQLHTGVAVLRVTLTVSLGHESLYLFSSSLAVDRHAHLIFLAASSAVLQLVRATSPKPSFYNCLQAINNPILVYNNQRDNQAHAPLVSISS